MSEERPQTREGRPLAALRHGASRGAAILRTRFAGEAWGHAASRGMVILRTFFDVVMLVICVALNVYAVDIIARFHPDPIDSVVLVIFRILLAISTLGTVTVLIASDLVKLFREEFRRE